LGEAAQIALSDGERVTLRTLAEGDAEPLLAFYEGLSEQTDWFYAPFAGNEYTPAKTQELVAAHREGQSAGFVVVNEAGEIVAHCYLQALDEETPVLGIGIADRYQNRRLGHALMRHLIDYARDVLRRPGVRLDLNADNPRAFHLYRKMGFVETGRKVAEDRQFGRFGHGKVVPMIDMALRFGDG